MLKIHHKKDLKLLDVFGLAVGTMVSSGLFILSGIAQEKDRRGQTSALETD